MICNKWREKTQTKEKSRKETRDCDVEDHQTCCEGRRPVGSPLPNANADPGCQKKGRFVIAMLYNMGVPSAATFFLHFSNFFFFLCEAIFFNVFLFWNRSSWGEDKKEGIVQKM